MSDWETIKQMQENQEQALRAAMEAESAARYSAGMSDDKLKELNAKVDSFGAVEFANKIMQEAERRGFMRGIDAALSALDKSGIDPTGKAWETISALKESSNGQLG